MIDWECVVSISINKRTSPTAVSSGPVENFSGEPAVKKAADSPSLGALCGLQGSSSLRTARTVKEENSSKSAEASREGASSQGTVHVHGMWYQASPNDRVTSENPRFRENLANAYLTMTDGIANSPANVDGHLWTDRPNLRALYMPAGSVEIPHSMIAQGPLSVHLKGEIGELIDNQKDETTKETFKELINHGAGENIGARADINRLVYTSLYSKTRAGESGEKVGSEINVHIDIDTMDATNLRRALHQTEKSTGNDKQLSNLQQAKVRLTAMKQTLDNITLPKTPTPLTPDKLAILASQPQKSWSVRTPVARPQGPSINASAEPATGNMMQRYGLSTRKDGNDVVIVVPQSGRSIATAKNTLNSLSDNYLPNRKNESLSNDFEIFDAEVQSSARYLRTLIENGINRAECDTRIEPETVLDYYRFAEKIRKLKPALQEKLDGLSATAKDETVTPEERASARRDARALVHLYNRSSKLVQDFVNKGTYVPQVEGQSKKMDDRVDNFLRESVFGVAAPYTTTDSWQGQKLKTDLELKGDDSVDASAEKRMFKVVKAMIALPLTDDLG